MAFNASHRSEMIALECGAPGNYGEAAWEQQLRAVMRQDRGKVTQAQQVRSSQSIDGTEQAEQSAVALFNSFWKRIFGGRELSLIHI